MGLKGGLVLLFVVLAAALAVDVCDQTCDPSCYACEPLQMDGDSAMGASILGYGQSTNISVFAANAEPNVSMECQYAVDYGGASQWASVTNDGAFHQLGDGTVTAPTDVIDYQVYNQVNTRIYCRSNITNATTTLWCGGGCIELIETYMYPDLASISEHQSKKLKASARLFEARKAIDEALLMLEKARIIIGSATSNIDAAMFYLRRAEEKYADASDTYGSASYAYESNDFDESIDLSQAARALGEASKQEAFLSYNTIAYPSAVYYYVWSYINTTGQSGNQTQQIIDTLRGIIGGPGGGGVPPGVKDALGAALDDLEKANALLDEANRRLLNGDFSGAQDLAEAARRLIEEANRKLREIFLTLLNSLAKSLLSFYEDLAMRLGLMQDPVMSVLRIHGAEEWEIKAVTADIDAARRSLDRAYSLINNMKGSEDIATLSRRGEIANLAMKDVIEHMNSAMAQIQNVLFRTYIKIAAVAAVAAILTSIIWRYRNKFGAPKEEVKLAEVVERRSLLSKRPRPVKIFDLFEKK